MLPIKLKLPEKFLNEENRDGYLVSCEMKKIWAVELDLLSEFMRVCTKYNITYYADAGTILGAVRHKGFIPWDDDIDVMMFRDQYQKLCKIAKKEFKHPYFFQTEDTDPGSLRGHAQLRNSLTTGILQYELAGKWHYNQGIFLDIFPIDSIPDDDGEFFKMQKSLSHKRTTINYWIRKAYEHFPKEPNNTLKANILFFLFRHNILNWHRHTHRLHRAFEKGMQRFNDQVTNRVAKFFCWPFQNRRIWDRSAFNGAPVYMDFEFLKIPLPPKYEYILDTFYGNWKEYKIGSNTHGSVLFDVAKPYTEYIQ